MEKNFNQSLLWLAAHEGGLTKLKNDSGGLTNFGVTQADYDHYRRFKRLPLRSVSLIDAAEVRDDFYQFYWIPLQCDKLPSGIDYAIFDMGVNNGVTGCAKCAQAVVNNIGLSHLVVDGHIGPITLDAIDDIDPNVFIDKLCSLRLQTDAGFANWKTFGKAWTNRVNGNPSLRIDGVRVQAKSIIDKPTSSAALKPPLPPAPPQSFWLWALSGIEKLLHRA